MHYLDHKYIGLVSNRLRNFKRKGPDNYNFSCPFCGDSETDLRKARGYLYDKKGASYFFCHNQCGGLAFGTFLKRLDALLYQEWRFEKLVSEGKAVLHSKEEIDFSSSNTKRLIGDDTNAIFHRLPTVASLESEHPARRLLNERKIPKAWQGTFRYTPGFKEFTNSILPNKFKHPKINDDGRIIIPFFNADNNLHAFQGRAISATEKQKRYISIVVNEEVPCIWGLDRVDLSRPTYVHEGVLDAIFIPNSLAIAGGNFASLHSLGSSKNLVIIYDNEPRSKDTKAKMVEAIEQGFKIVIWPSGLKSKDINDMIKNEGLTSSYIQYIIERNIYEGLRAKAATTEWSKR